MHSNEGNGMKCPDCGGENPDDAKTCLRCDRPIEWWRIRTTGRVGKLNPTVLATLDAMPRTYRMNRPDRDEQKPELIPAEAILADGKHFPCTLFVEVSERTGDQYLSPIGSLNLDYEFDEKTRRKVIMPELVSSVAESPYRTPPAIEKRMDQAAFHIPVTCESFQCKIVLVDGSEYLMVREDWDTQFIVLPDDVPNSRISDAVPLDSFEDNRLDEAGRILPDPGTRYCMFTR